MTSAEIVKALRCTSTPPGGEKQNCELCAFYRKEPLNDELREKLQCEEWFSCDTDAVGLAAADLIERLEKEKAALLESIRGGCVSCKHWVDGECGCTVAEARAGADENYKCEDCDFGKNWEWKGLKDEK